MRAFACQGHTHREICFGKKGTKVIYAKKLVDASRSHNHPVVLMLISSKFKCITFSSMTVIDATLPADSLAISASPFIRILGVSGVALILAGMMVACQPRGAGASDWAEYLGGPDRNHYSALTQIDSTNVQDLRVAWEYHAGDSGQVQCNPIIVNNVLYGITATVQPF